MYRRPYALTEKCHLGSVVSLEWFCGYRGSRVASIRENYESFNWNYHFRFFAVGFVLATHSRWRRRIDLIHELVRVDRRSFVGICMGSTATVPGWPNLLCMRIANNMYMNLSGRIIRFSCSNGHWHIVAAGRWYTRWMSDEQMPAKSNRARIQLHLQNIMKK